MSAPQTLMFFTKTFPYGNGEQYIDQELPLLAKSFERVIIVPCSIFSEQGESKRILPANVSVFQVNLKLRKKTFRERIRNTFELIGITLTAMMKNKDGAYFRKELARSVAILRQQMSCADAVNEYLIREKIDLSTTRFYSYWMHSSAIILGLLKKRGVISSFISRAHSYDLYHQQFYTEQKEKSPLPWEYFKFQMADCVYCISAHGQQYLRSRYTQWKEKFRLSYLGIQNPGGKNPLSGSDDQFRIVTCSSIQPLKRLNLIPEIISHLPFNVEWVHFGTGEEQHIEQLKESCGKYLKPDDSFDLRGFTPNTEVKTYYANNRIDLFMNVSKAEGVPVSLMEAAGYGIPLFATDVYGNSEVVRAEAGFLVPEDPSPAEAAKLIASLREDHELEQEFRVGARNVQRMFFDAERNFKEFIQELISQ